jgi:hypothetical protein
MRDLELLVEDIGDPVVRENVLRLREFFDRDLFSRFMGRHIEIVLAAAVTNFSYPHGLGFLPQDLLMTRQTDGVTVTWKYDSFTSTDVVLTTTGPCTIRAFVGSFVEG